MGVQKHVISHSQVRVTIKVVSCLLDFKNLIFFYYVKGEMTKLKVSVNLFLKPDDLFSGENECTVALKIVFVG